MNFSNPIEMPRGTHYGNNFYSVYSKKVNRTCNFFSNLEYYNFLTLEMNPLIETFCEQPLEISIILDDKPKKAIFDMWVKYKDGAEEFQEVKYEAELNGNSEVALRSQEQIRREQRWCADNHIAFTIRTDKDICAGRYTISNLNVLAARNRKFQQKDTLYYNKIITDILSEKTRSVDELFTLTCLPLRNELEYISYLYYSGIITMDIATRPFDKNTEVSLCQLID